MEKLDTDGDGKITLEEFRMLFKEASKWLGNSQYENIEKKDSEIQNVKILKKMTWKFTLWKYWTYDYLQKLYLKSSGCLPKASMQWLEISMIQALKYWIFDSCFYKNLNWKRVWTEIKTLTMIQISKCQIFRSYQNHQHQKTFDYDISKIASHLSCWNKIEFIVKSVSCQ